MYHHEHCKTGQIGVVAVLKHKPTGKRLIVATTHLAFNPYRGDWKLKQSIHLIAEITKQIELSGDSRNAFFQSKNRSNIPILQTYSFTVVVLREKRVKVSL